MVVVNNIQWNDMVSLARYVGNRPNETFVVSGGDNLQEKRLAASIVKNMPTYVSYFGKPESPKQWEKSVQWCSNLG